MDEVSCFVGLCLGSSSSDKKIFMPGSSSGDGEHCLAQAVAGATTLHATG